MIRTTRRRFLTIAAAAGVDFAAGPSVGASPPLQEWRGSALGAIASIRIAHSDASKAHELLSACRREIDDTERLFSLHREDSALSRLNREAVLNRPPPEMVSLLRLCRRIHRLTDSHFDPSVQPLWLLYAEWFQRRGHAETGPSHQAIAEALGLIDFDSVEIRDDRIMFAKPGMALTLNGIAQGYLADRIGALMRKAGVRSALIETGETLALGDHPQGRSWRIGIQDPLSPERLTRVLPISGQAVATSSPTGTVFEPTGRFHHIFDPTSGLCADDHKLITVCAPSAAVADGLSTAFISMPPDRIREISDSLRDVSAIAL